MAITKSVSSVQDWTAVAQNTTGESAVFDASASYEAVLHIQAFLDTATVHTGTEFIIQTSSAASGDEDWEDFTKFVELVGTSNIEAITNNPLAVASTTITCVSTTGYVAGAWRAIEDGTLVNSELVYQTGLTTDTNITIEDGTANEHVQNVNMYSVAMVKDILLPIGIYRARLLINNTYDVDGSTINYKVRAVSVTAI